MDERGIIFSDQTFMQIYNSVHEFTMTSEERVYALYQAVKYVVANDIPGDFVECGVWRGGSALAILLTLKELGDTSRNIYMYDTFQGMSEPCDNDIDFLGNYAKNLLELTHKIPNENNVWCCADLSEVKKNLSIAGYPADKLFFVKGRVEDTIPGTLPERVSLLRLDTDWYESTYHELVYLFPLLSRNGILIVDDYGHWQGAKKAVDQYFKEAKIHLQLQRIDYSGRMGIKI